MFGGFEKVGTVFLHIEAVIDCTGHSGGDSSVFEQSQHVIFVDGSLCVLELGLKVEHGSDFVLHEKLDMFFLSWG